MRNAFRVAVWVSFVCLCLFWSPCPGRAQQRQSTAPAAAPSAPAPPESAPASDFYTGDGLSLTLSYWLASSHPSMGTGRANINTNPSNLDTLGTIKPAPGAILSFPAGKHNTIRVSYFRTRGDGNIIGPAALTIFGTDFVQGDVIATNYTLQNAKISLDYLSWPFPLKNSKFRLKTLWEVQATWIRSSVDAPLRYGEVDASGNPVQTTGYGTDWFIYPSFGLGVDYLASKNFRFEARASGFTLPHRATIWDAEATANYRVGQFELEAGAKAFHFKTSPQRIEYLKATPAGLFVGVRWYASLPRR